MDQGVGIDRLAVQWVLFFTDSHTYFLHFTLCILRLSGVIFAGTYIFFSVFAARDSLCLHCRSHQRVYANQVFFLLAFFFSLFSFLLLSYFIGVTLNEMFTFTSKSIQLGLFNMEKSPSKCVVRTEKSHSK